ncbi:MAG: CPBP family intramembrane metalloprotease, partial [Acidobacteriaceae bacterium]|nr:CPBP family intramembrane metalloprotease [Acidobacteriaceae bacterium]
SSVGRLRSLGLEYVAWERVNQRVLWFCVTCGLVAGSAIILVARLSGQPLGLELNWNMAILALAVGPVMEEVVFRGYLLRLALVLTTRLPRPFASWTAVISAAVLFASSHLAKPGITALQMFCIAGTGCIYGCIRIRYHSTAASALTHAAYNLALYLSFWFGLR